MGASKRSVSVIIPNHNNVQWLESCINSCLLQGDYLREIIVIDDNSDDGSWQLLKEIEGRQADLIKVYRNPANGANEARNFGFENSSGEYIQWLDSDDFLLDGKFRSQVEVLENSDADITYSDWKMTYYRDGKPMRTVDKKLRAFEDYMRELLIDNWTCPHNYLLRRNIADKLASGIGWNPLTAVGQDREYFTIAAILGAKFVYVPGTFSVYNRWSSDSISGTPFAQRLVQNQLIEKRFRTEIVGSELLSDDKKSAYTRILNTHKIKACFYNKSIRIDDFLFPWQLNWNLMHWKMRLVMPFILAMENIRFLFRKWK